ncbi:MAG: hypothetical protein LBT05_10035 [Planctomycetaceae bacterium]|jgi:hypothetical protein|nr:hypothetical protein [Planctomycetaceae bacterium]
MFEIIYLDSKTVLIKSDNEQDLSDAVHLITQKEKTGAIDAFLKFASENRFVEKDYKFKRDDCYDR